MFPFCVAQRAHKAHTLWRGKKKGGGGVGEQFAGAWAQEGNHFGSNNTVPLISLISSFLRLKVYYSGKSAAVVFALNETAPTSGDGAHSRGRGLWPCKGNARRVLQLTLIFVPSSSGSGSGIISIWEDRKQSRKRKKSIREVRAAWRIHRSSRSCSEDTVKDVFSARLVSAPHPQPQKKQLQNYYNNFKKSTISLPIRYKSFTLASTHSLLTDWVTASLLFCL